MAASIVSTWQPSSAFFGGGWASGSHDVIADARGGSDPAAGPSSSSSAFASSSFRGLSAGESSQRVSSSSALNFANQFPPSAVRRLDQVQELGGQEGSALGTHRDGLDFGAGRGAGRRNAQIGHSGCVNALSWSSSGELLASGSDDTRVILWKVNSSHTHPKADQPHMPKATRIGRRRKRRASEALFDDTEDPMELSQPSLELGMAATVQTGHTNNIFSVLFLPQCNDSRLATAAGDSQIRVCDINRSGGGTRVNVGTKWYDRYDQRGGVSLRTLRCHKGRAKRLVPETSDVFLSVAEDGDIRSHDLRVPHTCRENCPRPLLHSSVSLYSLTMSPMQPYLFAVAGMSNFSFLYDRRMIGRSLEDEWGLPIRPKEESLMTKCVRRFGLPIGNWDADHSKTPLLDYTGEQPERRRRGYYDRDHITAIKISDKNSNDLIASYSGGAIYRFGIRDEPGMLHHRSSTLQEGGTMESSTSRPSSKSTSPPLKKVGKISLHQQGPWTEDVPPQAEDTSKDASRTASDTAPLELPDVDAGTATGTEAANSALQEEEEDEWTEEESVSTDGSVDSPTEQEANGFPLFQQLIADGLAEDLDLTPDEDEDDENENDEEDDESSSDEEHDDTEDEDGEEGEEEVLDAEDEEEMMDYFGLDPNFSSSEEDDDDDSGASPDYDPIQPIFGSRPSAEGFASNVPITYPRGRYTGHLNVETVKEVNFLGQHDQYVVSGSDDGNFYIWDTLTSELLGIWQGDDSVVNVVVQHPSLPVLAVSGIDDTIKIFAPCSIDTSKEEVVDGKRRKRQGRKSLMHRARILTRANAVAAHIEMNGFGDNEDDDEEEEEEEEEEPRASGYDDDTSTDFTLMSLVRDMIQRGRMHGPQRPRRGGERLHDGDEGDDDDDDDNEGAEVSDDYGGGERDPRRAIPMLRELPDGSLTVVGVAPPRRRNEGGDEDEATGPQQCQPM